MALNQDFTLFQGDTIDIEYQVGVLPFPTTGAPYSSTYNLAQYDQAAFVVATTPAISGTSCLSYTITGTSPAVNQISYTDCEGNAASTYCNGNTCTFNICSQTTPVVTAGSATVTLNSGPCNLLLKSTFNWNRGLYNGNINNKANSTAFSNGLPQGSIIADTYQFIIPTTGESSTTSTDGQGAVINVTINYINQNELASFSPSIIGGGHGFVSGDTLTIKKENFTDSGGTDATTDLVITLDSDTQPLPNAHPDNIGGVEIIAENSFLGPVQVKVSITGSDYDSISLANPNPQGLSPNSDKSSKEYYYELVAGVLKNYTVVSHTPEFETQVIAQGKITVNPSLFTENGFRGPY